MDNLMDYIEWIFSGIGVVILVFIIKYFTPKNKNVPKNQKNKNVINITNNVGSNERNSDDYEVATNNIDDASKEKIRILFVDDQHTKYRMVSILKRSGWINTKSVKDIFDLDDPKIHESDIIFVDINGVGTVLFEDQGLGLASALKNKYPEKKIVLYSAETSGDRFHEALRLVDACLPKNAEPYQFINLVETLMK